MSSNSWKNACNALLKIHSVSFSATVSYSTSEGAFQSSSHYFIGVSYVLHTDTMYSTVGFSFYTWVEWGNACKESFSRTQRCFDTVRTRTQDLQIPELNVYHLTTCSLIRPYIPWQALNTPGKVVSFLQSRTKLNIRFGEESNRNNTRYDYYTRY